MAIIGDPIRAAFDAFKRSFANELQEWLVSNSQQFSDARRELQMLRREHESFRVANENLRRALNDHAREATEFARTRSRVISTLASVEDFNSTKEFAAAIRRALNDDR